MDYNPIKKNDDIINTTKFKFEEEQNMYIFSKYHPIEYSLITTEKKKLFTVEKPGRHDPNPEARVTSQ